MSRENVKKFMGKMKWGKMGRNGRNIGRNWKNYDVLDNVDKWITLLIKVVRENEWKWGKVKDRKGREIKEMMIIK